MAAFQLAQYNIAWLAAPLDDPRLADFTNNLDRVNRLAEEAPGFVWRHQSADGNSTSVRIRGDDRLIINFSVWGSVEALFDYAFHSSHVEMFRRRSEWFTHEEQPYAVLWWIPAGRIPTVAEAESRLALLGANGPTTDAFTFRARFPAPDGAEAASGTE